MKPVFRGRDLEEFNDVADGGGIVLLELLQGVVQGGHFRGDPVEQGLRRKVVASAYRSDRRGATAPPLLVWNGGGGYVSDSSDFAGSKKQVELPMAAKSERNSCFVQIAKLRSKVVATFRRFSGRDRALPQSLNSAYPRSHRGLIGGKIGGSVPANFC